MKSTNGPKLLSMKFFSAEATRFLFFGALNTAIGYALYLGLLIWLSYSAAYSLAYVMGIVISYALNTWFVFRAPWRWRRLMTYPIVYVAQYLLGMALMLLLVEGIGVDPVWAPLFVVALTVPVTFLLSRQVIKGAST